RQVRPDRDAYLGDAVALRRRELRGRAGRDQLVRRVRAVEVAEVEAARRDVVDDRDGQRRAVGAADLAAEHVVDNVLARPREEAVAVQVLLEVKLARRGLDDALLDAGAVGRQRGGERPGGRRVEGRHAELARHQVDHRAGDGLALRVRAR